MMVLAFYVSLDFNAIEMNNYSYLNLALLLCGFVFSLYITLRAGKISRFAFLMIVFLLFVEFISLLSGTDWKDWAYYSAAIGTPLLLFNYYEDDPKALLIGMWIGMFLALCLGSIDALTHPERWVIDDNKDNTGYLLGGNYNGMGCRALLAILANIICLKFTRWGWLTLIPLVVMSVADLFAVQSMTSVTCVLLFLALCLIPSNRLLRLACSGLLVAIILFEFLVCFSGKGLENNDLAVWFIVDVLDKDITFTNRTEMWDSALRVIIDSPIWGYGMPDVVWYTSNMSSFAIGPHNMVLGVIIYGGVIAFVMYILLYIISLSKLLKHTDRSSNIIYAAVVVLSLMMLMEAYPIHIIFYFLLMAYSYDQIKESAQ